MRRFLFIVWTVCAFVAPASAQTLTANLAEARLLSRVKIALAEDPTLRAFSFAPQVEAGVLTVRGTVETDEQRRRVGEVIEAIEGVERAENRVRVGSGARDAATELPRVEQDSGEAEKTEEAAPEPERVYHTVRRGDTLIAIARRYGVSVRQVRELNGLRGSNIRAGQRLRVK